MSASNDPAATAGAPTAGEDVRLDLSEDEAAQEESSEVISFKLLNTDWPLGVWTGQQLTAVLCFQLLGGQKSAGGFWTFEYYQSLFNVDTVQVGANQQKHHTPCV